MKKLMIAAAIVCAAAFAQAATVTWSSNVTEIKLPNGTGADGDVTMYLYQITEAQFGAFSGSANDISTAVYNQFGTTSSMSVLDDWGVTKIEGTETFTSGQTAYAAVVFAYNDGEKDWYIGNVASYTFDSSSDAKVANLDLTLGGDIGSAPTGATSTALSWQSVPEPTSGLLLLIGMAGLALRRRRA